MADTILQLIHETATLGRTALENNTVFGDPLTIDGTTVIPVYRVSYGFAGGGFEGKDGAGLTGGAGAGVTKKPVGYLSLQDGCLHYRSAADGHDSLWDKLADLAVKKLKKHGK